MSCFSKKKSHLTKTEMGSEVQGILKREMVNTNHEFSTKSLSEKCSLNAYNILFVPKKTSQDTVAHLTKVIPRKHSLQYYTLWMLLTESKANLSRAVTRQHRQHRNLAQ